MSGRSFLRRFAVAAGFAAFAWIPVCAVGQSASKPIPIRMSTQPQPSWLQYTAKELGLFEKVGLAPTYLKFLAGVQLIGAVQGNSLDIATPGVSPFSAGLAQGLNWRVVGWDDTVPFGEGFVARADTNIKTLEDLKGRTVGVTRGSTSYYGLIAALRSKGISRNDVKLLILDPPGQLAALQNKNIDAAAVWQPWIEKMKTDVGARLIGMEGDYGVYTAVAVIAVREQFLKENPEAVKRYLTAMVMAYDHIKKNGPAVTIKAVAEAMNVSESVAATIYKQTIPDDPRLWIRSDYQFSMLKSGKYLKQLQDMADLLHEDQILKSKVDVSSAIDPSYITEVLKSHP